MPLFVRVTLSALARFLCAKDSACLRVVNQPSDRSRQDIRVTQSPTFYLILLGDL